MSSLQHCFGLLTDLTHKFSSATLCIFYSGDVSSPFTFCIGYVLDYVCHSGSLPTDGVMDFVLQLDIKYLKIHI